ncbi:hypothetical protein CHS0354_000451 [Potamilus streckersoni]|uniref:magnesium chelatase n=1 Tax=Potamilus streckersoni TaxID=2493646 RepID=A0AAE0T7U6_9BIVA|nr:hypothetical protein CHS0354_000451 [Potamilus streckersoni]
MLAGEIGETYGQLRQEIAKKIIGQESIIEGLVVALISRGHALMIGVPGLAKTLIVSTVSEALELSFSRIQFTPDLMPSDITGTEILEEDEETRVRRFHFMKGPIFSSMVLADEINRTPPKTQAALLEAMQERKVTSSGKRYNLPDPFFVLATQNPVEQEGTYSLPEAQLDRFMFSLNVGYPSEIDEFNIVRRTTSPENSVITPIWNAQKVLSFQELVREIPVADNVIEFAVKLVRETRPETTTNNQVKKFVTWGAGPRASQYLILAAKARALLYGLNTPTSDDVAQIAYPILQHRIITSFAAEAEGMTPEKIIDLLIKP